MVKNICYSFHEASSHDRIKMTKLWLEHDQKCFTPMNLNIGTWPKIYTDEHLSLNMTEFILNIDEYDRKSKFNFGNIQMLRIVRVKIFRSCFNVKVRLCQFFGHVHKIWSPWLGQVSIPRFHYNCFVMMLRGMMMVWLVIQWALGKASSVVWLLLCRAPGWWWSKLQCNLV